MSAVAAAWVLSLGVDLLLHAGLLARLYAEPSPFLLGPQDAFLRIPLGYLAFLVLTVALHWFLRRLGVRGARAGFLHGTLAGLVLWGALVLGLYSISTASAALLVGWWLGQALELGLAGAVLGAVAGGAPLKRLWVRVIAAVVACFAAVVVLQTLGLAPAMEAGPARENEQLGRRLARAVESGEGARIDLRELSDLAWTRLHVFPPYTAEVDVERELGFAWSGVRATGIHERDDIALLVFVESGRVTGWLGHRRGLGDFSRAQRAGGYAREESVFRVRMDGSWPFVEPD